MNNKQKLILVAIVIIVAGIVVLYSSKPDKQPIVQAPVSAGYKDASYTIDSKVVKLTNGVAEEEAAPGSAAKIVTRYFGNEVKEDLDGDGREDTVFLLTQEAGGSGTFFYVVAALNKATGYEGSQGFLLGDRIAPQTTEKSQDPSQQGVIIVNYADRAPGESMTAQPSVGKSIWLKLDPQTMQFGEVAQNFEGEADPSTMTLNMKSWTWIKTAYNDAAEVVPHDATRFVLTFDTAGNFSAKTDCNSVSGSYTVSTSTLSFGNMASTLMYCDGSQEGDFTKALEETTGYHFTSKGELIFDLKNSSGSAIFR